MQEEKNLRWRKVLQLDFYSTSTPSAATCLMPWKLYRSKFHPWCTPPEYQRTPFVALGPSSACTSHLWSTIHLYGPWSRRISVVQRPATPQISYCQAPRCLNWIETSTFEPHGEPWINQNHPPKCDLPIRMIYQSIHPTKKKKADHWCISCSNLEFFLYLVGARCQGTQRCRCRRYHPAGIANAERTAAEVKHLGANVFPGIPIF